MSGGGDLYYVEYPLNFPLAPLNLTENFEPSPSYPSLAPYGESFVFSARNDGESSNTVHHGQFTSFQKFCTRLLAAP